MLAKVVPGAGNVMGVLETNLLLRVVRPHCSLSLTHSLTYTYTHPCPRSPLPLRTCTLLTAIVACVLCMWRVHCVCGVCIVYAVCALCMWCVHCVCGVCRQQVRGLIWFIERPLIWADDWLEATAIAARANSAGMFKGLLPRPA